MTNSNNLPPLPPGYSYAKKLAEGGQGSIWMVLNANMGNPGRQEICKILTNVSQKNYQRFCLEIQTLAGLSHPNIVTIYYANPENNYFIMEFLKGGTLRTKQKNQELSVKQSLQHFVTLAETVHIAHTKGLVHRDLKPENILFTEVGILKVADFGISKLKDTDISITNAAISPGTPMYMAPELWNDPKNLDHRSDVWALGVMLYEMITEQLPWNGPVHYIMNHILNSEVPPPHQVKLNLSPLAKAAENVCLKALRKDLSQRYQTAQEMAKDINKILAMGLSDSPLQESLLVSASGFSLKEDDDLALVDEINDTNLPTLDDSSLKLLDEEPHTKPEVSLQSPDLSDPVLDFVEPPTPTAAPLDFSEPISAPSSPKIDFAEDSLGFAEEEPVLLEAAVPQNVVAPSNKPPVPAQKMPPKKLATTQQMASQKRLATTQRVPSQKRLGTTQRIPTNQQEIPTNYMMLGINATIALVMIIMITVFSKPSLSSIEKKLRSDDVFKQEKALMEITERGHDAFPLLFIALGSNEQYIREEAKAMISKHVNDYLFDITAIVKNNSNSHPLQARIEAIDLLRQAKAKEQLGDLSNAADLEENIRQRVITAMLEVDPEIAKYYYFKDDMWVKENYLINKGYVKVGEEWKHYTIVFEPAEKQLVKSLFIFLGIVGVAQKSGLSSSKVDEIGQEFYTKILQQLKKYETTDALNLTSVKDTSPQEQQNNEDPKQQNEQKLFKEQRQILAMDNLQKILGAIDKSIIESGSKDNNERLKIIFERMQEANDKALEHLQSVEKQLRMREAQIQIKDFYQAFFDTNELSIKTLIDLATHFSDESSWNDSIEIYKLAQINIAHVLNKPWPRKILQYSRLDSLNNNIEEKLELIRKPNSVYVWLDTKYYSPQYSTEVKRELKNNITRVIEKENYYPMFIESKEGLTKEKPKRWLECIYKEIRIGSYQPKAKTVQQVGKEMDRIRALCEISYWESGDQAARWRDVVTSSPHLMPMEIEPVSTLQERMHKIAVLDFEQKLNKWKPDFSRKVTIANKVQKEKKDTLYEQNATETIYLKDGRKLQGLIKKQTKKTITFVTFSQLSRNKTFYADQIIRKKDIKKVKKLPKEIREKRLAALEELQSKGSEKKDIGKIALETIRWDFSGGSGWKYESKHFELLSNTPQDFTKEISFRTEGIFDAFEQYFQINRNSETKIKIYVFNSMTEYQKVIGGAFANPAFYSPSDNHIMAACDLVRYQQEVTEIKRLHDSLKSKIEQQEGIIKRIRDSIRSQREVIQKQIDQDYREGRIKSRFDYNERIRNVRNQVDNFNRQLNKAKDYYNDLRDQIRRIDYRNKRLIDDYIDAMISLMYHEAFHGFLQNFLFTKSSVDYVPRWLNEGLAQFFENAIVSKNQMVIGEMDKERIKFFRKYLENHSTVPMDKFLRAGAKDFIVQDKKNLENSTLHYTQSWAVVYYLASQYNLKQGNFFANYVSDIWRGKDPVQAFEKLVEMPIDQFEEKWRTKMLELK